MGREPITDASLPPRVADDVDIVRLPSPGVAEERWRVSIGGRVHFLSDAETAWRIYALAHGTTYAHAHRCYAELAGFDACGMDAFMAWGEKHRAQLEKLAGTPDGPPLTFRQRMSGDKGCDRVARRLVRLFRRLPPT